MVWRFFQSFVLRSRRVPLRAPCLWTESSCSFTFSSEPITFTSSPMWALKCTVWNAYPASNLRQTFIFNCSSPQFNWYIQSFVSCFRFHTLSICLWLISLSLLLCRSVCVVANVNFILFYGWSNSALHMHTTSSFIHSSVNGYRFLPMS